MHIKTEEILKIEGVSKTYKTYQQDHTFLGSLKNLFYRKELLIPALHPISFTVKRGEFVGVLGPNGAGKTTTLKILTGLITPTTGKATALGQYDTSKRLSAYLKNIGMVMGQRQQLLTDLPALDSFYLSKALYEIEDDVFDTRLKDFLKLLNIEHKVSVPVRKLSLGERMKMELILSMLHHPKILFLDEPTIGLDFHAAKVIREFLLYMNREFKMTILLTSHYSKDIEELCERVILINHGHRIYDGPLSGMDARIHGQRTLDMTFKRSEDLQDLKNSVISKFQAEHEDFTTSNAETLNSLRCTLSTKDVQEFMRLVLEHVKEDSLSDILIGEQPLDEIFTQIYKNSVKP